MPWSPISPRSATPERALDADAVGHRHRHPVRLLPDRHRDVRLHEHLARRAGLRDRAAIRPALPDEPGAGVAVDATQDDGWNRLDWMQRYRLWQADREIFLWPENWLVEADRPNRSEIFDTLMQEARQTNGTATGSGDGRSELHRPSRPDRAPARLRHVPGPGHGDDARHRAHAL